MRQRLWSISLSTTYCILYLNSAKRCQTSYDAVLFLSVRTYYLMILSFEPFVVQIDYKNKWITLMIIALSPRITPFSFVVYSVERHHAALWAARMYNIHNQFYAFIVRTKNLQEMPSSSIHDLLIDKVLVSTFAFITMTPVISTTLRRTTVLRLLIGVFRMYDYAFTLQTKSSLMTGMAGSPSKVVRNYVIH